MSLLIRVKDANYRATRTGFYPPVAEKLHGWFFCGGSLPESSQNYLNGGSPGAATAGLVNTNDLTNGVSVSSAVQNTFWETAKTCSFILVASAPKGNNLAVGNSWASTPNANGNYVNSGLNSRLFNNLEYDIRTQLSYYTNPTDVRSLLESDIRVDGNAAWQSNPINFICGTIDAANMAAAKARIYLRNVNGVVGDKTVTADLTGKTLDFRNLGVYGVSSPAVGGNVTTAAKIYAAALFSKALSTVEIEKLHSYFKGYYDRRNVTGL
jgi:hypothetical protein